jgi:hypothetical protein
MVVVGVRLSGAGLEGEDAVAPGLEGEDVMAPGLAGDGGAGWSSISLLLSLLLSSLSEQNQSPAR